MNERMRHGPHDDEISGRSMADHEKYARIMNRLSDTIQMLVNAGVRGDRLMRLSESACMKAIQELKDAGFQITASSSFGGPPPDSSD